MPNKKLKDAAGVAEQQLKAGAKKLQSQLATVEQAAGKLASRAKERLPAPTEVTAMAKDVMAKRAGRGKYRRPTVVRTETGTGAGPDESWSVADLRAEAKRRGMTGYSRKTKDELLAALRG